MDYRGKRFHWAPFSSPRMQGFPGQLSIKLLTDNND